MKPIHLSGALGVFSRRPMADGGSTTPKDNPVLRGMFGGLPPEQDAALRKRMLESITPAEGSYMASVRDRIQELAGAAGDKAQSVADTVANRVQGVIDAVKQKKGELTWPEGTPFKLEDYRQEMRNTLQNYQNQAADFIPSRVRAFSTPEGRAQIAGQFTASLQDPANAVNFISPVAGFVGTFAGVGAKTADLAKLAQAREMLAKGATDREAWAATGWTHAFPDGKPRFEISDDRAVFNTPDKLQARYEELMQRNDQIRQQLAETQPKNWGPDLFQRQLTDARNAIKNEHTQNIINSQQLTGATNLGVMGGTIAPVAYEHPELYKAYPELANIRVKQGVYPEAPEVLGYHQGPEIGIGQGALDRPAPPGAKSQPASTMGHEMQHSVQDIEGFARGTMPSQAAYDWEQDMKNQMADLEALKAHYLQGRDPYQLMNKRGMFGGLSPEEDFALQKWSDINDRLFDLQKQAVTANPIDLYKRHAGEVEARLTQNSMTMTPEQRASSYPLDRMDVPPEQQIVRFNRTTDNPAAAPGGPMFPTASMSTASAKEGPAALNIGLLINQGPLGQGEALRGMAPTVRANGKDLAVGPFQPARDVAAKYMRDAGLPYNPPTDYAKVDPERAKRLADAYEQMPHNPNDPAVKASYDALTKETMAQWQAMKDAGVKVEFMPGGKDPYGNPRNATEDVRNNNHLYIYPTDAGFGEGVASAPADHPMLKVVPGETISGQPVRVNDLFRAVHDYFGHVKEGVGFRADGEENAWRNHAAMFSPEALPAMTAETRGQNSWVNFGPNAEFNKTASGADTKYAAQKAGILPTWAHTEGLGTSGGKLDVNAALEAIKKNGGEVTGTAVHQSATEPTLVVTLKKPLSDEAMNQLALDTHQEAIPQLKADGTGKLHGPAAEKWGDFNPDYFITPNGKPLSEAPITMDVMGQHYSREPHDVLSGTYFGRGAKSEESARLAQADDPRLRQRINAYVDEGKGVVPEGDVGNVRHDVPMTGLYNIKDDPFNLRRTVYSDDPVKQANTMESRIVDAGFPGYYAPQLLRNGDMGHAVLLGDASKNVKPAAINGKPMSLSMANNPPSMPRPEPGGLWHETPTPYNPDLPVQFTLPGGEKGSARVMGDVPEGARISSFSMADIPTSKADLVAAGYYHPIGAGLKLRTPFPELSATRVPIKDLPPHNIISPEDLLGGVLVPAIGDRTAAGAMLTHIGGQELAKPTLLEGGPDFMRTHMGEGAAWAANKAPAMSLSRLIRQAAELGGGDVYMPYVAMSPTAGDFSTMMSSSLLNQARTAPIAKKSIKAFDESLSAQRPEWPGLHSPDAEAALSQNGELRKAFVQEMAKTQHADRGFPDVPATRFGITEPSLLDVPTGASGFSIARMDPSGRIIEDPTTPHSSYGTQLAGTFMGGLDQSIPREVMFPNWYASRRAAGAPEAADPYSFMRNPPIQPVDESWVNDVQSYMANRPDQNYAEGGTVSKEHNFPVGATVQLRDYKGDPQEYNIAPGSYSPTELADHLILQGAHAETALRAVGAHDHPLLNR